MRKLGPADSARREMRGSGRCAGRLASKHALIAEKAEGHHAHLMSIPNGVHHPNGRRDDQSQYEPRTEQADPRLGRHGEPSFRY
jgi:hypothetical protein